MHRDGAWGAATRAKAKTGGILFAGNDERGREPQQSVNTTKQGSVPSTTRIESFVVLIKLRFDHSSSARISAPHGRMKSGGHVQRQQDHVRSLSRHRLCWRRDAGNRLEDPERTARRGFGRCAYARRME